MASCPMAMKRDVEGYIAIMFALTFSTSESEQATAFLQVTHQRPKGQVAKDSDDLIRQSSRSDSSTYDDIHPPLGICFDFIEDREKLSTK